MNGTVTISVTVRRWWKYGSGDRVLTIEDSEVVNWSEGNVPRRRWGEEATIREACRLRSGQRVYLVDHDDGAFAWYEHEELAFA